MQPKLIEINGRPLAGGRLPAVCAPLVARTLELLLAEAAAVAAKKPDLLEWRVDFFDAIDDTQAVVEAARLIKQAAGGIPVLFTRRSMREGGEKIALAESEVIAMYRTVCASGHIDMIDYEMSNEVSDVREVRDFSRAAGVKLILSFHDFQGTPTSEFIRGKFEQGEQLGADVAKVAVMPRHMQDVLVLLGATLQASEQLTIPVVSMSMGGMGSVTRLCGWTFGSAMSFAVGQSSSAPGQMPIEDMNAALAVLRRSFGAPAL